MELEITEKDRKDFKILFLSNAPFSPSGYGVQTAGMCYDWVKKYNVRVLSNYGVQGRMIGLNDLVILPALPADDNGGKTARFVIQYWKPDVFITLYDIWMGAYVNANPANPLDLHPIHPTWIPITMVDHEPAPEGTIRCARVAFKAVTPTRWSTNELKRHGIDPMYIPFGVYTNVFKPLGKKAEMKRSLEKRSVPFTLSEPAVIDEDSFVVIINGANKDPYRKAFTRMFIAAQLFLENNPDAKSDFRIYVHSWMKMARDIPHGAKVLGVDKFCKGTSDYHAYCGVPDPAMNNIYNAGDVFMHLSQGGGFEIPILEACAAGVPPIATDFISMKELTEGHGWLIPPKTKYMSPLDASQAIADEYKAADALEDAYNHPKKRSKLGKKAREFSLQYDWSVVNPLWYRLFDNIILTRKYTPLQERVL